MVFELNNFWHFYSLALGDHEEELSEFNPEEVLYEEYLHIRNRLDCHSPVKNGYSLKKYIRLQQRSMVRLVSLIETLLHAPHTFNNLQMAILKRLLELSESLLDHLLLYHPESFDYKAEISGYRYNKFQLQASIIQAELKDSFHHLDNGQTKGLNITDIFWNNTQPGTTDKTTFGEVAYHLELLKYLKQNKDEINSASQLLTALLRAGYSRPGFIKFYHQRLLSDIHNQKGIAEQYKTIIGLQKQISQLAAPENNYFKRHSKKLKKRIHRFLEAELSYIKGLDFVTTELINTGLLDSNYKVSLSVKQLAYYIYLNVEAGIITEQRAKKVHQYITTHVDTIEKAGVSEKSFKNAYYVHAPEDVKKIIEKLGRMLAIAHGQY